MTSEEVKKHLLDILNDNIISFTTGKTQRNLTDRNTTEQTRMSSYHGRELLELLQNIDDAYQGKKKSQYDTTTAFIKFDGTVLSVCNMGTTFEKDNVERLCQGGVSGKKKINYIGNKGVGFRSVLNWAKKIEIFSGDYSFRFSDEFAKFQFDKIKENELVRKQISERKNLQFPILAAPEYIEPEQSPKYKDENGNVYDTIINITVDPDKLNDGFGIKEQVNSFDEKTILFLPNIGKIEFILDDSKKIVQKEIISNAPLKYKVSIDNDCDTVSSTFYYFSNANQEPHITIDDEESLLKIAVAIPEKLKEFETKIESENNYFYTFFPLRKSFSPFKALLHATFALDQSRDFLDSSKRQINEFAFKELLSFYVSVVAENFTAPKHRDLAIQLLTPFGFCQGFKFRSDLGTFNLDGFYYSLCKEKKIFLSVADEFMCPEKGITLYFSKEQLPQAFKGECFKNLILTPNSMESALFIAHLIGTSFYSENDLLEIINSLTELQNDKLTVCEKIELFYWWNNKGYKKLPNLLLESGRKNYLTTNSTCFLSGSIDDIPSWAKIHLLDTEYENELIKVFKERQKENFNTGESDKRILPRLVNKYLIDIQEQSSKAVLISPINQSIDNNYDRALEFIRWLWKLLKSEEEVSTTLLEIDFNMPCKDKEIRKAKDTYLGEEYDNSIGEIFFKNSSKYKILDFSELQLEEASLEDSKVFLSQLGVRKYPYLEKTSFKENNVREYLSVIIEKHPIEMLRNWSKIELISIENIVQILESLDTAAILKWIFEYKELKDILSSSFEPKTSVIGYQIHRDYWDSSYRKLWPSNSYDIIPYLKFIFMNTKWIRLNENKYSPRECIINNDVNIIKQIPETINSKIRDQWLDFINKDLKSDLLCDDQQLTTLLKHLGMANKLYDFETEKFYSLLLKLQEDKSMSSREVSRKIYRQCCIEYDENIEGTMKCLSNLNNSRRTEFLKNGKVWAINRKGNAEYHPVTDTKFSSSAVLNLNNKFLIDIPNRNGNKEKIFNLFNVEPFEEKYETNESSIKINDCIQKLYGDTFQSFLTYVLCYRFERLESNEIELYKALKIYFVSDISVNDRPITEPYTVIQGKTKKIWYIYIGELNDSSINNRLVADCIEQIFNVLLDFPSKLFLDKIGNIFLANDADRGHIYDKDFGTPAVYEQVSELFDSSITEENKLLSYLKRDGLLTEEVKKYVQLIDFYHLSEVATQEFVFKLLTAIKRDIDYLQTNMVRKDISVEKVNRERLRVLFEQNKENFFERVYALYETKSEEEKCKFLETISSYDVEYNKIVIPNTIYFNPDEIIEILYKKTGINEITANKTKKEIESIFENSQKSILEKKNQLKGIYGKVGLKYTEKNCHKDFGNFTGNNHSLFYYDLQELIFVRFEEYLNHLKQENDKSDDAPIIKPADLERMENAKVVDETQISNIPENSDLKEHFQNSGKGHDDSEDDKKTTVNEDNGGLGELAVVKKLRNREIPGVNRFFMNLPYEVTWISKYANKYENKPFDDLAGYDVKLVSKEANKTLYIEIKSSKGSVCDFNLSENELKRAKKNPESYRIIFVSNIEKEPSIYFIDRNILDANDEYKIIPLKYRVKKIK